MKIVFSKLWMAFAITALTLLAQCRADVVSLNEWWSEATEPSKIGVDPIGGYLLFYWVDINGNACHGEPGRTGQPGPKAFYVYHQQAILAANRREAITSGRLLDYQLIPYNPTEYIGSGVSGLHFYQFDNFLWRIRDDGTGISSPSNRAYSIPQVISLDNRAVGELTPIAASNYDDCFSDQIVIVPNPDPPGDDPGQHPTLCRRKIAPQTTTLDLAIRLNYCLLSLPHGIEYH